MQVRRKKAAPPRSADSLLQQLSEVVHNSERDRFELYVAGDLVGVLGYRLDESGDPPVMTVLHTVLYDEYTGHGLAGRLAQGALDFAAASGRKVDPVCTFLQQFLRSNPRYAAITV